MDFDAVLSQQEVVNQAFAEAVRSGDWQQYHTESSKLALPIEQWVKAERRDRLIRQILKLDE